MNLPNTKDQKKVFSLVFIVFAVLLAGLTSAELFSFAGLSSTDSEISPEVLAQLTPDDEKVQEYLSQYQAKAEDLIGKNSFVPPPSGPEAPGDCTAIFGDEARIGDRWVSVGDRIGEAKVIEIGPTRVTLMLEDRRITRSPVLVAESNSRDRRGSSWGRESSGRDRGRGGRGSRGDRPSPMTVYSDFSADSFELPVSRSFDLGDDMWQDATVEFYSDGAEMRTIETSFGTVSIGSFSGSGDGPTEGTFNIIRATPEVIKR